MREVNYSDVSRARRAVEIKRKRVRILVLTSFVAVIMTVLGFYFEYASENTTVDKIDGLNVQLQSEWTSYEDSVNNSDMTIHQILEEEIEMQVNEYIKSMSLEKKIAQLIITTPESLIGISQVVQAGDTTRKKINQHPVGGLIFSDKNFNTIVQIQEIINSILVYNPYPIFIALDDVAATRVGNTNTSIEDINATMVYRNKSLYIGKDEVEMDHLVIDIVEFEKEAIELLKGETEMLIITSKYEDFHGAIYNAVIEGKLTEEEINLKLKSILEYKITSL